MKDINYKITDDDKLSPMIGSLGNNIMRITCKHYGLLNICKNCTAKLSNEMIDNDVLIKDCYKRNK